MHTTAGMRRGLNWRIGVLALLLWMTWSTGMLAETDDMGFQMDPILVERVVSAGSSTRYIINVDNSSRFQPLTFEVEPVDIVMDQSGAYQLAAPESTPYSIARWITVDPQRLTVPPNSSRTVAVTIDVPRGVSGGRYGAVALTVVPERSVGVEEPLARSEYRFQMASFIELVIAGSALRLEAYPDSFTITSSKEYMDLRRIVGDDALVFSLGIANEGNVHIVANGELTLRTEDGRTVARIPIGGGRGVILPGTTVAMRSILPPRYPPGEYTARAVVDYGGHRPVISEMPFTIGEGDVLAADIEVPEVVRFWVAPQVIELTPRSGAYAVTLVEVFNRGDEVIDVEGVILPLAFDRYGDLVPEAEREAGPDWIEIAPASFRLEPGRSRRIRVSVRPPQEASGGYYADILFKSGAEGVYSETGTSLMVFVDEQVERTAEVEVVGSEQTAEALALDFLFLNTGTIHLHVAAELVVNRLHPQVIMDDGQVIGARSERIGAVEVPADSNPVLPGAERVFSFLVPTMLEEGEYEIAVRFDFGGDEPRVLRFRLVAEGEDHDV